MPIFSAGTGVVPVPNRSLPFAGGGGFWGSAASRNFGWAASADLVSAYDAALAGSLDAGDADWATPEALDPSALSQSSANGLASAAGAADCAIAGVADCTMLEALDPSAFAALGSVNGLASAASPDAGNAGCALLGAVVGPPAR